MFLLLILTCVIMSSQGPWGGGVSAGFDAITTSGGIPYIISDYTATFSTATSDCLAQDKQIVAFVDNAQHRDFVDYLIASGAYDRKEIWVAITESGSRYYFSGGEEINTAYWFRGEPNRSCSTCCYRLVKRIGWSSESEHKYADNSCTSRYYFVCTSLLTTTTTTTTTTPEPTTTTTTPEPTTTTPEPTTTTPEPTTTTTPEPTTTTPEPTTTTPEPTTTTPEPTTTTPQPTTTTPEPTTTTPEPTTTTPQPTTTTPQPTTTTPAPTTTTPQPTTTTVITTAPTTTLATTSQDPTTTTPFPTTTSSPASSSPAAGTTSTPPTLPMLFLAVFTTQSAQPSTSTTSPSSATAAVASLAATGSNISQISAEAEDPEVELSTGEQMSIIYLGLIVGGSLAISCICSTCWLITFRALKRRKMVGKEDDEEPVIESDSDSD